ncbi:LacI family DNA-binding transcriptional regulator [Jonesiaceae bacterium BS-20]|uniref:LacI family DNA-binding transcriptional regulator n=1 Tax=Jonesiaceae bacterium BS-20 TaxID=3120821 RepID=A0AAU7DV48_9MICO
MSDVAALAGVGVKTVSRVINEEPNVSLKTKEKVLRAVQQLGYQQDLYAGNLRRSDRRTRTLGLLISSVANPYASTLHRGVEGEAARRGTAVFAASLDDDPEKEQRLFDAFVQRRVDGLILTAVGTSQSYISKEHERGTPMVFVDRIPQGVTADVIVADNFDGAFNGTNHLLKHGHRRIAYFGDNPRIQTSTARRDGYSHALMLANVPVAPELIFANFQTEKQTYAKVLEFLQLPDPPTAIFSGQNLITIIIVRALRDLGLSNKIALVGFDDFELADLLEPPLTVVAQDPEQIGILAAKRIFERLDGDTSPPSTIIVPTKFIVRGSGEIRAQH